MDSEWDVIVIGGGAAGLSAALVLGRARKQTLVLDAGRQSNLPAHGIGGLLGQDGVPPEDFYAAGRLELAKYPTVQVRDVEATGSGVGAERFEFELSDGSTESARRVLLAVGLDYGYPEIPGIVERWGSSVFHCPFCHGWEARDGVLGVLNSGQAGATMALLLRGWSDDITLYTNGPAELEPIDAQRLSEAQIPVDEREISELLGQGDALEAIAFADGDQAACEGLLVKPSLSQRSQIVRELGVTTAEDHPMVQDAIEVDSSYRTNVEGVFAAGDATGQMPSVANSVAAGSNAAGQIVHSLI